MASGSTTRCKRCGGKDLTSDEAALHQIWSRYKKNSTQKGRVFALDLDYFAQLIKQQCHYCGVGPSNTQLLRHVKKHAESRFEYNGIDRMDSSRGYARGNVVPCCADCNRAKLEMTPDQFISLARRIVRHQSAKSADKPAESAPPQLRLVR